MSENITRSISGIIFIVLLVFCTLYSETSFILLFSIFALLAVYEFTKLVNISLIASFILVIACILLGVVFEKPDPTNNLMLCIATLFISVSLLINLFRKNATQLFYNDNLGKFFQLLGYVIFPFVIIMKLPYMFSSFTPQIVIGIFILIWTNDTFAYIFGKYLGKHKLFERVSPKKTIEGFIGGLVGCLAVACLLSLYFQFLSLGLWLLTGLVMSIMGTLGDLVESRYKRLAGVKDSGKIMPGHGGILDRFDSVIFATPFLYFILFFFR
ncbi:phosphatidate cytidylyltransferase [Flavobacterium agricola]|uniref:Phosphatidate cytidylyltransferase n=1 Tax=Flavobacterium agricola TaxID=2870839 RepID=A0ABY6LZV3_9FLAO|nr:phosphatidate cytidylyltransferase [Flavobacterium agricola]UYW01833.1 phosphatidate cytidylyltransferase [Flavobacterium agricola]